MRLSVAAASEHRCAGAADRQKQPNPRGPGPRNHPLYENQPMTADLRYLAYSAMLTASLWIP